MESRFYVTTPIYYVNAQPHLGHAYTTIVCDALARYHRLAGYDTHFLTGTDEHGDKIVQAAQDEGLDPKTYADRISAMFQNTWPKLNISNDDFIRTTEARHVRVVQYILDRVHEKGDIYFSKYGGWYCYGCERFYTEKEMAEGNLCPDHQRPLEYIEEENYFFRMSEYQDWLIDHIHRNPDFIRPERYKNEVLSFLKEPLEDLCISRPKSRLTWGIELPFDDRFVTYVWFDALINYLTALGYPDGEYYHHYWPAVQHTVAKDILKPHGIYWPTMLRSAGIEPYRHLNVHGYWKVGAGKMSKSVGNVVDALKMRDVYGLDAFRYFLLREMVFGLDSEFSEEALVGRINSDLANDLGNLVQRSLTMVKKFGQSKVPDPSGRTDADRPLRTFGLKAVDQYHRAFRDLAFHKALMACWELIGEANRYIDHQAPWVLAKDPDQKQHLDLVLYELVETLALVGAMIQPVMPDTSDELYRQIGLNLDERSLDVDALARALAGDRDVAPGRSLFPRVEIGGAPAGRKEKGGRQKPKQPQKQPAAAKPETNDGLISFDDFKKVDLRVGRIDAAERVPKSDKLIKLSVTADRPRTIVAGVGKEFEPEDLVGRQVIVVANLAPAKLMGVTSEGMMLAATDEEGLTLLAPGRETKAGSRVS